MYRCRGIRLPTVTIFWSKIALNRMNVNLQPVFPGDSKKTTTVVCGSLVPTRREQKLAENAALGTYREPTPRSAQVGCLLQVTDFRRSQDGRLTLLVQGLELFVVDQVVQSLPYSVGHVQILPDAADPRRQNGGADENFCKLQRAKTIKKSFAFYSYEFADTKLPLPSSEYMDTSVILGTELAKMLPFAFYNPDTSVLDDVIVGQDNNDSSRSSGNKTQLSSFQGGEPPLERQLLDRGILKEPKNIATTADQSETLIWLALEDYCRQLQFTLPEQVLCLKPPELDYLDLPSARHPLSSLYPKERRQQRLSYTAAGFLPRELWQGLLEMGSTAARLEAVMKQFRAIQEETLGEFQ